MRESRECFMAEIGFLTDEKNDKYREWSCRGRRCSKSQQFHEPRSLTIDLCRSRGVFDTTQADNNNLIFNGLVTGQCGEQPLPPYGSCLLGSVNLTKFVVDPFTENARFDWETYRKVVNVFTRMLDNVVEINGLPLEQQRDEIMRKRRHGMGFLGLGSTITMLCMKYGSKKSIEFTEKVSREMAIAGWEAGLELAREKGPAPIMNEEFTVTREMLRKRPEMVTRRLARGRQDSRAGCCTRATAATCSASPRSRPSSSTSWPRSVRASRITPRSRRRARFRCRSPTTPPTASSRRSRTITSAT